MCFCRKARVNYTAREREDLQRILMKYRWLVSKETSLTDRAAKEKREAWEKVTMEFNEIEGHSVQVNDRVSSA